MVCELVKCYDILLIKVVYYLQVDDLCGVIKVFVCSGLNDLDCFYCVVIGLESELLLICVCVNVWVIGDIDVLCMLLFDGVCEVCFEVIIEVGFVCQFGLSDLFICVCDIWFVVVDKVLVEYFQSFVILLLEVLIGLCSVLLQLWVCGYIVVVFDDVLVEEGVDNLLVGFSSMVC